MNIDRLAEEYAKLSAHIKASEERKDTLKKLLLAKVEEAGEEDEKGNYWLAGTDWQLKREKRVKPTFDEEKAMEWALENAEDVIETITPEPYDIVNRDALAAFAFLHPEHKATIKSFHGESVTWAFAQPVKQTAIDY